MRRSEGYIYVEMLAGFFVCCFIGFSLLPMFTAINSARKNAELDTKAAHLLYKQLEAYMEGETLPLTNELDSGTFDITWSMPSDYPGFMEGCLKYESFEGKSRTICDLAKR
ncbi:hypothetical protein CVD28_23295 [Bacillus sp. M6-12]|uniref:hypothetical protein n=1 Tax=Bacillus sp. M6-12 TaxID=2054166 RepID=UPI000C78B375|nr:hypothetical protein [Bacillus sp. M6-12]PLS15257.1 hypothetical protein CVD28_23295 [Bacillus sp. M6-12]